MKLILGSDRSGYSLRCALEQQLQQEHSLTILGPCNVEEPVPFYETAAQAARALQAGEAERAILICGTGMGVAQVANKFKGVRAACVESVYAANMARAINDSNVLCLGGWFIAPELGLQIAQAFLGTAFTEGLEPWRGDWLRGAKEQIAALEEEIFKYSGSI